MINIRLPKKQEAVKEEKAYKTVYCLYRVSTAGQVDHDDIPMQREACQEFASRQNGWVKEIGFKEVYLKSEHHGLYEKYGFEKVADFEPIQGPANQLFRIAI